MVGLGYTSWINVLQQYGVLDFLLPFLLVFTIIYAVLSKTKILGGEEKKQLPGYACGKEKALYGLVR